MVLLVAPGPGASASGEIFREALGQKAWYGKDGELLRVDLDEDRDGRFEGRERYENGRRLERDEDRDGDGVWERRFRWDRDGTATLTEDAGRGPVRRSRYAADGTLLAAEEDAERDGTFESVWEYRGGQLQTARRPDGVWRYDAGGLRRAELDENADGRPERVEYYGSEARLERVEELTPAGAVTCVWYYGPDGTAERAEEDRDGDGRRESVRRFLPGGRVDRTVDRDGDGRPEIREVLSGDGVLVLREEDLDGDGRFDLRTGREE
jgi:hypothetical protein